MNKVALVTGASSGIGQEITRLLTERGLRVFGTARKPGAGLLRLDVTDEASVAEAVQAVLQAARRIDVLVNNAGYALAGALEETSIKEAQALFDTNFFGVLRMVRAVLPEMRRQGSGRIVNISSLAGLVPIPYRGIYAASKPAPSSTLTPSRNNGSPPASSNRWPTATARARSPKSFTGP